MNNFGPMCTGYCVNDLWSIFFCQLHFWSCVVIWSDFEVFMTASSNTFRFWALTNGIDELPKGDWLAWNEWYDKILGSICQWWDLFWITSLWYSVTIYDRRGLWPWLFDIPSCSFYKDDVKCKVGIMFCPHCSGIFLDLFRRPIGAQCQRDVFIPIGICNDIPLYALRQIFEWERPNSFGLVTVCYLLLVNADHRDDYQYSLFSNFWVASCRTGWVSKTEW